MIEIRFKNGVVIRYKKGTYTEYKYDGKLFVVVKDCKWIGMYNIDCIRYICVNDKEGDLKKCLLKPG